MGWIHYDIEPGVPNTLDELTNAQLLVIADKYNNDYGIYRAYLETVHDFAFSGISNIKFHVKWVYDLFNRIQTYSKSIMEGETVPDNRDDLVIALQNLEDVDIDSLTTPQVTYIVNQMISHSKEEGTGDFTFYSSQF